MYSLDRRAHTLQRWREIAFPRRVFQERFHRSGAADGHNDLVRVDVFPAPAWRCCLWCPLKITRMFSITIIHKKLSVYGFSPSSVSSSLMASMTLALRWAKCCLKLSSLDPPDVSSLVQRFLLIRLFTAASGPEESFWLFISKWSYLLTITVLNSMMIFISFYFTLILPEKKFWRFLNFDHMLM